MNTNKLLPRDYDKLQKISGCSRDSIVCYFYRRRKKVKEFLRKIPDLRDSNIALTDPFDKKYLTKGFHSYEYLIDKFSLKVRILAKTYSGETLVFDIDDVEHFAEVVKTNPLDRSQVSSSEQENRATGPHPRSTVQLSLRNEAEYFQAESQDNLDEVDFPSEQ
jgi:hypothetical protein